MPEPKPALVELWDRIVEWFRDLGDALLGNND